MALLGPLGVSMRIQNESHTRVQDEDGLMPGKMYAILWFLSIHIQIVNFVLIISHISTLFILMLN